MRSVFQGWNKRYPLPNRFRVLPVSLLISVGFFLSISAHATSLVSSATGAAVLPASTVATQFSRVTPGITIRAGLSGDSDGDSIPDVEDFDDDNDTIPDDIEGTGDTDGDGIIDCLDLDSDNDGIPDLVEAVSLSVRSLIDADNDGQLDSSVAVGANGLADVVETTPESGSSETGRSDFDADGIRDQHDLDSDNDGVPDVVEAGSNDTDFDGLYDFFRDLDGDGLADRLAVLPIQSRDTDNDGAEDFRDSDSDNDGLSDLLENTGVDVDSDGRIDNFVDLNSDGLSDQYAENRRVLTDTDNDGFPDFIDTDSDGDGVSDSEEAFTTTSGVIGPVVATTPFNADNVTLITEQPTELTLETGENGSVFGCSLVSNKPSKTGDPVFLFMLVWATLALLMRGVKAALNKPLQRSSLLPVSIAALLLSGCSTPGGQSGVKPYVGVGVGASFLNANTAGLGIEQDTDFSSASQLTLGLSLNPAFAFELRAADLGEATFDNGDAVGYQVADASLLFQLRRSKFSGFARLGGGGLFNDGDIATTQKNQTHLLVGAGAEYAINDKFAIRGEWAGHDTDVMHSQLSVLYRFGQNRSQRPVLIADRSADETVAAESAPQTDAPGNPPTTPIVTPAPVPPAVPVTSEPTQTIAEAETFPLEQNEQLDVAPFVDSDAELPVDQGTSPFDTVVSEPSPEPQPEPAPEPVPVPVPVPEAPNDDSVAKLEVDEVLEVEVPEQPASRLRPLVTVPVEPEEAVVEPEPAPIERKIEPEPTDLDEDGINDASDNCADTKVGMPVFADGCAMFGKSVDGLSFFPDTDRLTSTAVTVLDSVADALIEDADIRVTVAAHTRSSTDPNAAMFLTRRRTIAIIRYLSNKGIEATRLRPEAYGDTQPLASAVELSENDRVVLTLQ